MNPAAIQTPVNDPGLAKNGQTSQERWESSPEGRKCQLAQDSLRRIPKSTKEIERIAADLLKHENIAADLVSKVTGELAHCCTPIDFFTFMIFNQISPTALRKKLVRALGIYARLQPMLPDKVAGVIRLLNQVAELDGIKTIRSLAKETAESLQRENAKSFAVPPAGQAN